MRLGHRHECECPVDHTIAKLGHCRTCPYYDGPHLFDRGVTNTDGSTTFTVFTCGSDKHADGTPHDFEWATYADETVSYGVCRCGLDNMTLDLMVLP